MYLKLKLMYYYNSKKFKQMNIDFVVTIITIIILTIISNSTNNLINWIDYKRHQDIGVYVISGVRNNNLDIPLYDIRNGFNQDNLSYRFNLEKQMWKIYQKYNKNIDVHFLECEKCIEPMTINTEKLPCVESYKPGIFKKTILAFSYLNQYKFYIRTNLSTFIIEKYLITALKNIPTNIPIYTGGSIRKWGNLKFVCGTSIVLNELAKNILINNVNDYNRDQHLIADDVIIGKILKNNGINITRYHNLQLYLWNWNLSFDDNIKIINQLKLPFIRLKPKNINKNNQIVVFQKLIEYYCH